MMKKKINLKDSMIILTALFVSTTLSFAEAEVGKPAPNFKGQDIHGKTHQLSDYQGKIVVLEAYNLDCPFCANHFETGAMQEMQKKVTDLGGGNWHYEYAVHNMNSDRAAQAFAVDFADGTSISSLGFHDFDHHSGEYEPVSGDPYSTTDWPGNVGAGDGVVSWETDTFAVAPAANAIRWSTMYNFWFDADAGPTEIESHSIALFKPGTPCRIDFLQGPTVVFLDDFETGDTCVWSIVVP